MNFDADSQQKYANKRGGEKKKNFVETGVHLPFYRYKMVRTDVHECINRRDRPPCGLYNLNRLDVQDSWI